MVSCVVTLTRWRVGATGDLVLQFYGNHGFEFRASQMGQRMDPLVTSAYVIPLMSLCEIQPTMEARFLRG